MNFSSRKKSKPLIISKPFKILPWLWQVDLDLQFGKFGIDAGLLSPGNNRGMEFATLTKAAIRVGGESITGDRFVPNDTSLDLEKEQIAILTGPNMAGKSTYIRRAALLVLLAHTGAFIPCALSPYWDKLIGFSLV